ncbi:MAG: hypothetical protein NTX03_13070, partial [Bacteroidetes bacterium]|nr:hypothetical protein [Bacteroidota bacterium]
CLQPTWLAQSNMPSADVVLVFGYLWGLNSILKNNKLGLGVALVLMLSVSLRGVVGVAALAATHVLLFRKDVLKNWLSYLIPSALFCVWIFYHFQKTGWAISTPADGWSYSRGITTPSEMLRNILVITKNHFDFGGAIIWVIVLIIILLKRKTIAAAKPLFIVLLTPILLFSISFVPFGNPIMHRYYSVGYLLLILVAVYFVFQLSSQLKRNLILGLIALGFITGNFWIYPTGIANGWDATVAHIPYFKLREKMIDFIQQEKIPTSEIGTSFPNIDGTKFSDLDTTSWRFKPKDLAKDKYIFESNIFNGFEDAELAELHSNKWILKKEFLSMQVYVRLYERRY